MAEAAGRIAENLARLGERIAAAAERSGRTRDDVGLVAVTKFVPEQLVRALVEAGCRDLGESRPQELWAKAAALQAPMQGAPVRWHLVGHLQRNKIRRTLPLMHLLHSIDSERLLAALDEDAAALGVQIAALLEVNISGEAAKHGFHPDGLEPILARAADWPRVQIRGLMGMAALEGGPAETRREFARLRQLRERLARVCPPRVSLDELSMGMSGDFELAIEEGATMVRIGSALFEGVLE